MSGSAEPRAPLWPQPIPIIGGTGSPGSGKTRFGLSIRPGPRTLVYDLEQSSASYAYIGFKRVDVQEEMQRLHPNGYKAIDLWVWWLAHVRSVPRGMFDVIMVDPVTDLERGLVDWVDANPTFFGHTSGQYASMSGIKWGDVKDFEKLVLADICARCQCLYFTAHLGNVWGADKKPTGQQKAKGKESLFQLASLYLWFQKEPNTQGPPSAFVMKSRLETGEVVGDDVVSYAVLPPRLPVATPKAIREYFAKPAGKQGLSDAEKVKPETLSDDDRLKLELAKAEAERDAAQARAAVVSAQQKIEVPQSVPVDPILSAGFVTSYMHAIDSAGTATELAEIPPQVKESLNRGQITALQVGEIRAHYDARKKQLEAAVATAAEPPQ